ncbi:MAG: glycosyltransferase family 4 protein [Nitrosomonas sp.]|nr:MAG: glycosyltransferase family 4 protein [Nitrosomonas sp.]
MDNAPTMVLDFSWTLLTAPLLAFFLSFLLVLWLINRKANWALDQPNFRSLHTSPVPRSGGVGVLFGIITTWLVFHAPVSAAVWFGVILIMAVSFADDIRDTPAWIRLIAHSIAAIVFVAGHLSAQYSGWLLLSVTGMIIWMSNLYNFMDGSDGLAGGMTVIGFVFYGWLALLEGSVDFAQINFVIAAAALAFLFHNFYPARIFLGDTGSVPLGFLAAVLGITGYVNGIWEPWFPCLVFSPFIADATVTLIKRLVRGKKIWQAHREHYYQYLVQHGWGHRNTALLGYTLMLGAGGSAFWAAQQDPKAQLGIVAVWICIYLVLMLIAECGRKRNP